MDDDERKRGRRTIMAVVAFWATDPSCVWIEPAALAICRQGHEYGLPPLIEGMAVREYVCVIRAALHVEQLVGPRETAP